MIITSVGADDGRLVVDAAVAPLLTHLAVGTGGSGTPDKTLHGLVHEIGRVLYLQKTFVVPDAAGAIIIAGPTLSGQYSASPTPTPLVYLLFQFQAAQAQGNWNECALCGNGVQYIARGMSIMDTGTQAGDDRANRDVVLIGSFTGAKTMTITLTVTTGGGNGVAHVGWASVDSAGATASGTLSAPNIDPTLSGTIVSGGGPSTYQIPSTGITPTFSGGVDGVLTLGDQWVIKALADSDTPAFASGGVYDPFTNRAGQVRVPGTPFQYVGLSSPFTKGNTIQNVGIVAEVLSNAA